MNIKESKIYIISIPESVYFKHSELINHTTSRAKCMCFLKKRKNKIYFDYFFFSKKTAVKVWGIINL